MAVSMRTKSPVKRMHPEGKSTRAARQRVASRGHTVDLGHRVRTLRGKASLTLQNVADRSGLSISAISKIENGQLSPTYENLVRLARGLSVDVVELFTESTARPSGRRSITLVNQGFTFKTPTYDYEMLCTDLVGKKMIPFRATIKAREVADFSKLIAHEGEELILVLSGRLKLMTEFYEPMILGPGDCVYFDSTMGHVCLTEGMDDAEVFWVCSTPPAFDPSVARKNGHG